MPQADGRAGFGGVVRLPVYPIPADGEVLSSYVARLAAAHRMQPVQLTVALGLKDFWCIDPDLLTPADDVGVLEGATGHALEHTSLRALLGEKWESSSPLPRLVLETPRTRMVRGMPVCPLCVQEGRGVKRIWRLATTLVCERHGRPLVDACLHCRKPTQHFNRQGIRGPGGQCRRCQAPLEAGEIPEGHVLNTVLEVQGLVQQAFTAGAVNWGGVRWKRDDFISFLSAVLHLFVPDSVPLTDPGRRFESSGLTTRLETVAQAGVLMDGGLVPCLWALRQRGVHPLRFCRKDCAIPQWLQEVVEMALLCRGGEQPYARAFRFSEWQWKRLADAIPSPIQLGSGRSVSAREVIEGWLTGNLCGKVGGRRRGQLGISVQVQAIRAVTAAGVLDRIVDHLLMIPEAQAALGCPATVRDLLAVGNSYSEGLWTRMVQRRLEETGHLTPVHSGASLNKVDFRRNI